MIFYKAGWIYGFMREALSSFYSGFKRGLGEPPKQIEIEITRVRLEIIEQPKKKVQLKLVVNNE